MDKKEAIKRLDALENEANELRIIIESADTVSDKIKTYSDVCKELGIDILTESDLKVFPEDQRKQVLAFHKLQNVVETLNQGWKPDWSDTNQKKYYPYFDLSNGCSFDGVFCRHWDSIDTGGARLVFKTKELAEFAGKTFQDLYKDLLID